MTSETALPRTIETLREESAAIEKGLAHCDLLEESLDDPDQDSDLRAAIFSCMGAARQYWLQRAHKTGAHMKELLDLPAPALLAEDRDDLEMLKLHLGVILWDQLKAWEV